MKLRRHDLGDGKGYYWNEETNRKVFDQKVIDKVKAVPKQRPGYLQRSRALLPIVFMLLSFSLKAGDTIQVKEGYVMVQYNKHGPAHKVKCDYITLVDGEYYVKGKKLKLIKHV